MKISSLLRVVACVALLAGPALQAGTYEVTSLADGPARGTLRWALNQANANPGSEIGFKVKGTITLRAPLPAITAPVTIDGASAPDFKAAPTVAVNFANKPGLLFAKGAEGSILQGLSLVNSAGAAVTLQAARVNVAGNYVGLTPEGREAGNRGDGIRVLSNGNLIGSLDPITSIRYFDTDNAKAFPVQPVTAWQGLRGYGDSDYAICGTSNANGLLYLGPLAGGGRSFLVTKPGASATSVYGPDVLKGGVFRLVGSFRPTKDTGVFNYGFVWEGRLSDLPSGGKWTTIAYPGAKYQFTHSTMGGLAVGNADKPTRGGAPVGPGRAYIYDVENNRFIAEIRFPGSKSNSAYGIWHNGGDDYTICGGYSPLPTNNLRNQGIPLAQGRAFLVDYNRKTGKFSNWASFSYRNQTKSSPFITHFEGISSVEKGVYTMNADAVKRGDRELVRGAFVTVRRNTNGSFGPATWVDLNFPGVPVGVSSSNSVYGNAVVGLVIDKEPFAYQARINLGFSLSNVISGNRGNGVGIYGGDGNVIAQNYIGTDPTGSRPVPNAANGVLVTAKAKGNVIGGQVAGSNNPTGSEGKTTPTFLRPPQGNLISGNTRNGVLITNAATKNKLSSNFIGTDASGNRALGNGGDGVRIERAPGNALLGCTFRQDPFVFYNVVSGNRGNGVHLLDADDTVIQANFLGIGANNAVLVPNAGDGLLVAGRSSNTQVGGVIPLGNVISGNRGNGIAVTGTASGLLSFNTFGGGFAFGGAAPNSKNGILITSTGGNNTIRTCIISGNKGHGIEIGGNATGVLVEDTAAGTNTAINAALPNSGSGIVLSGTANNNRIGGFQVSIEARTHFAGNLRYGIEVRDGAHDNVIVNTNVGLGDVLSDGTNPAIPNQLGGVLLGAGTARTTIGGVNPLEANRLSSNGGAGLEIVSSTGNEILNNEIKDNAAFGVFGLGDCTGTDVTDNTITGNGNGPGDNVNIAGATGITVTP